MPINADSSKNIKWPLPEGIEAFKVANLFDKETLEEIKNTIARDSDWGPGSATPYHTIVGRWVSEPNFSQEIRDKVLATAKKHWGNENLRLKVLWSARYQQHNGVTPYLWEHMDQSVCQYTLDFCVEISGFDSWGVIVDGTQFDEAENSGIFFMGQQQTHSRPPYPVDNKDAYIILLFGLFVDETHWGYDLDLQDPKQEDLFNELIQKYRHDGDIRYYEHSGHPPYFNDLPENNYPCIINGEECIQCWVAPKTLLDEIISSNE
jgi:hypothetical protein